MRRAQVVRREQRARQAIPCWRLERGWLAAAQVQAAATTRAMSCFTHRRNRRTSAHRAITYRSHLRLPGNCSQGKVRRVQPAPQARPAHRAYREFRVRKESRVQQDRLAHKARKAFKAQLVQLELWVLQVQLDRQALKVRKAFKEPPVQPELSVLQVQQDRQARKVRKVFKDPPAPPEPSVQQVL